MIPAVILLLLLTISSLAHACPGCPLGNDVRATVWRDGFWENLGVALLPFLVAAAACVNGRVLERWLKPRRPCRAARVVVGEPRRGAT